MPWNEEEDGKGGGLPTTTTVYMLRSRRVMKEHGPSGLRKPKRKQRPKKFKPSKALREAIQRLVEKHKPPHDVPDYWPNMITESDMNSDSESSDDDLSSPVSTSEIPMSRPSTVTHFTPKVADRSGRRSLKEITQAHIEVYALMANLALEYYNFKEHANLKLVEVTVASEDYDSVQRMHINFIASSDGHSRSLLFAELLNDCDFLNSDLSGFYVQGCCVIEKVDSGNPLGFGCRVCFSDEGPSEQVQHPGPLHGYRIISGDVFQDYRFWDYHPFAYDEQLPRPNFKPKYSVKSAIYVVCAKKAIEYFNSKQQQLAKFKDAEVTGGAHYMREKNGMVVHINFMAQLLSGSEQELFFAVLSIPPFEIDRDWEDWKEPFVKVEACCRLEKVDSGNPFGRVCKLCNFYGVGTVIHPSPRDGHTAADGDDFAGYEFMNMGTGIY